MFDTTYQKFDIDRFGGAQTNPDSSDVRPPNLVAGVNVEFVSEAVKTRYGFTSVLGSSANNVKEMVQWRFADASYLVAGIPDQYVQISNIRTNRSIPIYSDTQGNAILTNGKIFSAAGSSRMYIASYGSDGEGAIGALVMMVLWPTVDTPAFVGAGKNDLTAAGTFTGSSASRFKITIDATGTPDTFTWTKDGGGGAAGVAITGSAQSLSDGVTITFASTTGHTLNDFWTVDAFPGGIQPVPKVNNTMTLNDMSVSGSYTGTDFAYYTIVVDSVGATDTFSVSKNGTPLTSLNAMTGSAQSIGDGISITFAATTGHALNDNWTLWAPVLADRAFCPPLTYIPSAPSEPTAGVITAGAKRLGYIIETRSGYFTRPGPDDGSGNFEPVAFTAAGSKNASWTLNTTWPREAIRVHVIMAPTDNLNAYYFVPGASAVVKGGQSQSVAITFDISDSDLRAQGEPVDANQFQLLSRQPGSTSEKDPIKPSAVIEVGDRIAYIARETDPTGITRSVAFLSGRKYFQDISQTQSRVEIPGGRDITTGMVMRDVLYLFGPNWTYATQDNQLEPIQWPTPTLIDGTRGTLAPEGVAISSSGDYGWVAHQSGLYLFTGAYDDIPISYYQRDIWNRITWSAFDLVKVLDDKTNNRVLVMVSLDGATYTGDPVASHILCWDYTYGKTAETARFSLWSFGFSNTVHPLSMALVQNDLAGQVNTAAQHVELWVSGYNFPILRQKGSGDTNPYRDVTFGETVAINSSVRTAPLPLVGGGPMDKLRHGGMVARLRGNGTGTITPYGLDGSPAGTAITRTLADAPAKQLKVLCNINSDALMWNIGTNASDAWFLLSWLSHYWKPYIQR